MKRKNLLRAKKYCNSFSKGRVFAKRLSWIMTHMDLHLKGHYRDGDYDVLTHDDMNCHLLGPNGDGYYEAVTCDIMNCRDLSVAVQNDKHHLRVAPHLHYTGGLLPWEPSCVLWSYYNYDPKTGYEDSDTCFIDEQVFITAGKDKAVVNEEWVRTFWAR